MIPLLVGIESTRLSAAEKSLFSRLQPAGYILFSRNIETPSQVRALTDQLKALSQHTPLLCLDQEGGRVIRTEALGISLPSAQQLAEKKSSEDILTHAHLTGRLLRQLGLNMNLAPVLDLGKKETTNNALGGRCWGINSQEVISLAGIYATQLKKEAIATCGKHFPGLGKAQLDAHFELPVVASIWPELLAEDVLPFSALGEQLLSSVMCAHVLFPQIDPEYPSSLSYKLITECLRNQLGYKGLVMTDDLDMGAITSRFSLTQATLLALGAGNTLAMICHSLHQLEEIAQSLSGLSSSRLYDIEEELKAFLPRLEKSQQAFCPKSWDALHKECALFASSFEALSSTSPTTSPVEQY